MDVFIVTEGLYNDMLPSRMQLIDKAIKTIAAMNEKGNAIYANTNRVRTELEGAGLTPEKSAILSSARIFGYPPGERAQWAYWYFILRSGEWDTRQELVDAFLHWIKYVYTEGAWGEKAPEAFDRQILGTEVLVKSWSDRTTSPSSGSYFWSDAGSVALAVKHITGKEPEYILSDVHDPDHARLAQLEDALREDYRVRLFNRKWIEGMMKEGFAGADQMGKHVFNALGWKIMRENSITDDMWMEIVDIYVHDKKNLNIREWFDSVNPYAFQEVTQVVMEAIRKGYWAPDPAITQELAEAYAQSYIRHGGGGGIRGSGNNPKLKEFIEKTLEAPGTQEMNELVEKFKAKVKEAKESAPGNVQGQKLERLDHDKTGSVFGNLYAQIALFAAVAVACVILFLVGFYRRRNR